MSTRKFRRGVPKVVHLGYSIAPSGIVISGSPQIFSTMPPKQNRPKTYPGRDKPSSFSKGFYVPCHFWNCYMITLMLSGYITPGKDYRLILQHTCTKQVHCPPKGTTGELAMHFPISIVKLFHLHNHLCWTITNPWSTIGMVPSIGLRGQMGRELISVCVQGCKSVPQIPGVPRKLYEDRVDLPKGIRLH